METSTLTIDVLQDEKYNQKHDIAKDLEPADIEYFINFRKELENVLSSRGEDVVARARSLTGEYQTALNDIIEGRSEAEGAIDRKASLRIIQHLTALSQYLIKEHQGEEQ